MNPRKRTIVCSFLLTLTLSPIATSAAKPNIVVILADDMNRHHPGFTGGKVSTPNLDRLAREGTHLTQFYVHAVCSPTRAAFLTGRYPFRNGMEERSHGNDVAGMLTDERTLAEALQQIGYFTAIIGKWHLGNWHEHHLPMQRGFDHQYGLYGALIGYYNKSRERYYDWHRNGQTLREDGYSTDLIAQEFVNVIESHDSGKPFFIYAPFNAVHGPNEAPPELTRKYRALVENQPGKLAPSKKEFLAVKYAMLESMDLAIGRMLGALTDKGVLDDTLVVFFNDNGGRNDNPPYRGGKGDTYEGGVRVSCIFRWPGKVPAGRSVDGMTHVVDLYPTLIGQGGGSLEQTLPLDGMNMWDTITKGKESPRSEVVHALPGEHADTGEMSIRQGKYKLVGKELFNIERDPAETRDIASAKPETYQTLYKRLLELVDQRREPEEHTNISKTIKEPLLVFGEEENANPPAWLAAYLKALSAHEEGTTKSERNGTQVNNVYINRVLILLLSVAANASAAFAQSATISEHAQQIDQLVAEQLEQIGQGRRPSIDDYTFCRRVYLDAIGRIPTIDELDGFLADQKSDKRARLVSKLLHSKGYQSHWYNYWADLFRVKYVGDKLHHPGNYSEWIKESLRSNKPYDRMAHELINASGPLYKPGNGATGFYAREPMPLDHLANSVKTFLGLSIECAQCHDHPFEAWTQKDFYKLAAFSSKTHLRVDPTPDVEKKKYAKDRKTLKNKSFDEWIVYRESLRVKHAAIYGNGTGFMRLPHDYQYEDGEPFEAMEADVLFGKMPKVDHQLTKAKLDALNHNNFGPPINSRQSLADWMVSPENPMFTKSVVNRLWYQVMGTELVGPLGGLSQDEMGDHPELTQELIAIMKSSNYDLKKFLGILFNSKIYQSKSLAAGTDAPDYLLDGPIVRRLSAEVIVDSFLSLKTETPDQYVATEFKWDGFTNFYETSQEMDVKDFVSYSIKGPGRAAFQRREEAAAKRRNGAMGSKHLWRVSCYGHVDGMHDVAMLMGKSDRDLIDGANREPNIPQILYLMNGHLEHEITTQPQAYLHRKLEGVTNPDKRLEIIWKAILGRLPQESEKPLVSHDQDDLIWALLNSNEFRFVR